MKAPELKTNKNSGLLVIAMTCLLIGTTVIPAYVKYPALLIAIVFFLYMLYNFVKEANAQVSSNKKQKLSK